MQSAWDTADDDLSGMGFTEPPDSVGQARLKFRERLAPRKAEARRGVLNDPPLRELAQLGSDSPVQLPKSHSMRPRSMTTAFPTCCEMAGAVSRPALERRGVHRCRRHAD